MAKHLVWFFVVFSIFLSTICCEESSTECSEDDDALANAEWAKFKVFCCLKGEDSRRNQYEIENYRSPLTPIIRNNS